MPQTAPKRRDSKCISGNGLKTDGGRFKAAQATIDDDESRAKVQDDGNVFKTGEIASNDLKTEKMAPLSLTEARPGTHYSCPFIDARPPVRPRRRDKSVR